MNLTPCEKIFLAMLDNYGKLLPDETHLIVEGREERLPRDLVYLSREDLTVTIVQLSGLISSLDGIVEPALAGGMRKHWIPGLKFVVGEFGLVLSAVHDELKKRIH